ncbi:MAG: response regulator transcription factor, partial [Bacillota bacterium]|nr:response regulator transcription factor [Bacillota bacterium]
MIYFLEDDNNIRDFVIYALNNTGLKAKGFGHPGEFWAAMKVEKPGLLLLDIMLPDEDGLAILEKLRGSSETKELPIIMLTAKGTEYDKVLGLDSGADDYITKPFGTMELISRVKALLRRTGKEESPVEYRKGALYICPSKHLIRVDGHDVTLTLKEFELLCLLFENEGIVLTRDEILSRVWGYEFDGESRTVDVHIRTLRSKLGDGGKIIETVRGIGYKIGGSHDEKDI